METELTCAVCSDIYLEGKREPVTLPECGHTFCRQCLLNVERAGNLSCPYCRTKHHGPPVAQMSTVYALLNLTRFLRRSKFGICNTHSSTLDFWCQTCLVGLCGFCLYENHNKHNHEVVIMKNAMKEKKVDIQKAGMGLLEDINEEKIIVMNEIHDCLVRISDLCGHARSLTTSIKDIKRFMGDAEESLSMGLVIDVLDKMKEFRPLTKEEMFDDAEAAAVIFTDSDTSSVPLASVTNESSGNRSCSTDDVHPISDISVSVSMSTTHGDLSTSTSSSDSDIDEDRNLPSDNGAAASVNGNALYPGCLNPTNRILLRHIGSTSEGQLSLSPPTAPSVLLAMNRRNHNERALSPGPATSDDNPNDLVHSSIGASADVVNSPDVHYSEVSQTRRQNDMAASEEGTDATISAGWLAWSARGDDGRGGRLRWEGGRLHLYTLSDEVHDIHGTIKLPVILSLLQTSPEVFLDLGIDGVRFGRVYIRIWGELRRAQHFMALCVGTLGPSFKGSRCSKVEGKDKPGECLRVNHYVTADGILTARGLMDGLEWSGEYSAAKREGLVVAASGGKGEYDGCFDICTRGNPTKKFSCPFGEVVSGLAVVKAATRHDPIGDLAIMNTGVVIINHTS